MLELAVPILSTTALSSGGTSPTEIPMEPFPNTLWDLSAANLAPHWAQSTKPPKAWWPLPAVLGHSVWDRALAGSREPHSSWDSPFP